ncbi:DUF2087 domain-containing protein [Nocardiopsis sediminis]|uniref:DUF2087 domain-containing protein n=1 Tax=Nocardiopsis sediminis TaxID=1778267 RepID=A0ABV8FNL8_9ACTN
MPSPVPDERPSPPSCGDIVGLLAQRDRRAAFAAVELGATTPREVAEATGLRPAAAAAALHRLTAGGLVALDDQAGAHVVEDAFRRAVAAEVRISGRRTGDGAGAYFRRGRLTAIPGAPEVRARVLAVVAETFTAGETYSEPKVNALCAEWLDDWVSLRRALVDDGLLHRDATGTAYRRA